jgi:type II secretory pathway predicted ATPase ExeA
MASFTIQLGGLSNAQHVAEDLELPILPSLGAVTACWQALDTCATARSGLTLIGPKGAGKTAGIKHACNAFREMEREKRRLHEAYRVRKVLHFGEIRCKTDREIALVLARRLDPRYSERANGQKKTVTQIRGDVVSACLRQQYAVVVVDEAESFSDDALQFLRDLLRDSRDNAPVTSMPEASAPRGLGILLIGDDTFDPRARLGREAGHRWSRVVTIERPGIRQVAEVYGTWFPGLHDHVGKVGVEAWSTYLSSVLARGGPLSLRHIENHAKAYAHYMVRSDPSISHQAEIGFNRHLFELAAEECAWAQSAPAVKKPSKPRSSRNGAAESRT